MELTLGNLITVVIALASAVFTYGSLSQKVRDIEYHRQECLKRFEIIESDTDGAVKQLASRIDAQGATLNQIAGKLDLFFQYFKKD